MRLALSSRARRYNFLITLIVGLFCFLAEYWLTFETQEFSVLFMWQLIIVYLFVQYRSIKMFGLFNIYSIYVVSIFIFSVGGVIFSMFFNIDFSDFSMGIGDYKIPGNIMNRSFLLYSFMLLVSYFSYKQFNIQAITGNKLCISFNERNFKIGRFLMFFFMGIALYKGYLTYKYYASNRTLMFLLGSDNSLIPLYVRFFSTFFQLGYIFIISSLPSKKIFLKYSVLYLISMIMDLLTGNRSMFGASVLFFIWFYYRYYSSKIRLSYIFVVVFFAVALFQYIGITRNGGDLDGYVITSLFMTFFLEQSTSFFILPLYMIFENDILYYQYPYILYTIIGGFSGYTGQSIEVLQHKCGIGHQLIYSINPDYYLSGASLGSSSISELYEFGWVGVFLGALFLGKMFVYFERKVTSNRLWLLLSLPVFQQLIMSPRGSYFPSLYGILKILIFYCFIVLVYNLLFNSTNHEKNVNNLIQ